MLKQTAILRLKQEECIDKNVTDPVHQQGSYCPRVWDGALCWPYVEAGTLAKLSCPDYVTGFDTKGFAKRLCLEDGTWFYRRDKNTTWTNYSDCTNSPVGHKVDFDSSYYNSSLFQNYIPIIQIISRVGYSISFSTLIVAFTILAVIKKLRCPRNSLHMHLFASFILRAFISLLKTNLLVEGLGLQSNMVLIDGKPVALNDDNSWQCKLLTALWQYFLMANYCWILMEGLYLHNLIFLALFSDASGICVPIVVIVIWATIRATFENTLCWTTNHNKAIFWILRGPITCSIIVNFVFFINISRLLFVKLTSSQVQDSRKSTYRKLAKSTLVLVPLFGVHYTAFMIMSLSAGVDDTVEIIWLFSDQFFASFQGFFVAVLYCFMNGEVQTEVRKKWQRWSQYRETSQSGRSSIISQSLTYFTRQRNSSTSAGEQRDHRRKSCGCSPTYPNADCATNTTFCTNQSAASPRLEHPPGGYDFTTKLTESENSLPSPLDKSPTSDGMCFNVQDFKTNTTVLKVPSDVCSKTVKSSEEVQNKIAHAESAV